MRNIHFAILALSAVLFTSCSKDDSGNGQGSLTEAGHEYVDLGLPSGALWSTEELEVNGSKFFSWGETAPKSTYSETTYKYFANGDSTLTKYCSYAAEGSNGFIDGKFTIESSDDPAAVNWGGRWSMPCWSELEELMNGCTWEYKMNSDSTYYLVGTSKTNGKTITIPTTGARQNQKKLYAGYGAFYWASDIVPADNIYTGGLQFTSSGPSYKKAARYIGHCVRPVIHGDCQSLAMVDLGLPSGLKWARYNLGAHDSTQVGLYYAWGEIIPKTQYTFKDYKYATVADGAVTLTKYLSDSTYGTPDNLTQLESSDDAAQQNIGNGWRMPTQADFEELMTLDYELDTTDVKGVTFIGNNGNKLFLPVTGTISQGSLTESVRAYYWTSTLLTSDCCDAVGVFFTPKSAPVFSSTLVRSSGRIIRPVHE